MHKSLRLGAAIAALVSTPLSALTVAAEPAMAQAAAVSEAGMLSLSSGIPITLVMAKEVNSSVDKEGDTFALTVLNDVKVGDTIVIPRGTPAAGEVIRGWRPGDVIGVENMELGHDAIGLVERGDAEIQRLCLVIDPHEQGRAASGAEAAAAEIARLEGADEIRSLLIVPVADRHGRKGHGRTA
ncbi:MAG: hypothetical protein ABI471_09950 [Sphingomonas bacterium]